MKRGLRGNQCANEHSARMLQDSSSLAWAAQTKFPAGPISFTLHHLERVAANKPQATDVVSEAPLGLSIMGNGRNTFCAALVKQG